MFTKHGVKDEPGLSFGITQPDVTLPDEEHGGVRTMICDVTGDQQQECEGFRATTPTEQNEILLLGYSEAPLLMLCRRDLRYSRASSFIRAFKDWCGATPGQWRAAQADR